jgi:hypothetical protein
MGKQALISLCGPSLVTNPRAVPTGRDSAHRGLVVAPQHVRVEAERNLCRRLPQARRDNLGRHPAPMSQLAEE